MSDLIDKQEVMIALEKVASFFPYKVSGDRNPYNEAWNDAIGRAEMEIEKLPSAEPERQTGHWVNNIHDLPICDQCGYMTPYDRAIDDYEYGNYCPNCGAKMEGEQQ